MSIYKRIKSDRLEARKRKDSVRATFLALVMGDIQRRAEKEGCKDDPTDVVSQAELKAYVKRYQAESDARGLSSEQAIEAMVVEGYLPKPASCAQIKDVIKAVDPQTMKEMGKVMGALKKEFDNFDGALVSKLVKDHLGL